jgi:Ulp1 family protease
MHLLVENVENRALDKESVKEFKDVVRRTTRDTDIFSCDKMYIPTNINNYHWAITVVKFPQCEIHYIRFYEWGREKIHRCSHQMACLRVNVQELEMKQWKIISKEPHVPQQIGNGTDCGVFCMMCADFFLQTFH